LTASQKKGPKSAIKRWPTGHEYEPGHLNAGHGAIVAVLRPTTLLALGTVSVDGTFGNPHLSGDQVADAMLSVGPIHLLTRVARDDAFLQAREGGISKDAHQFPFDPFDTTASSGFGETLSAEAFITPFVEAAAALGYRG